MRKFVLPFLLILSLFGTEITFDKNLNIESSLKQKFQTYWELRGKKRFYKTYNMEIPYLNYLHNQDWYEDYFANAPRIKKIVVKKIECKNEKCNISMIFYPQYNPNDYSFIKDIWVKVNNNWYHRYNDNPLPPMGKPVF